MIQIVYKHYIVRLNGIKTYSIELSAITAWFLLQGGLGPTQFERPYKAGDYTRLMAPSSIHRGWQQQLANVSQFSSSSSRLLSLYCFCVCRYSYLDAAIILARVPLGSRCCRIRRSLRAKQKEKRVRGGLLFVHNTALMPRHGKQSTEATLEYRALTRYRRMSLLKFDCGVTNGARRAGARPKAISLAFTSQQQRSWAWWHRVCPRKTLLGDYAGFTSLNSRSRSSWSSIIDSLC